MKSRDDVVCDWIRLSRVKLTKLAGRVYAAYDGVYVSVALLWLWAVKGQRPIVSDWVGVGLCLAGMAVIVLGVRGA